jgi:hypothetical protein
MNAYVPRKVLNVEFKQFQRLPACPQVKVAAPKQGLPQSDSRKRQNVLPPPGSVTDAQGSQTLAE